MDRKRVFKTKTFNRWARKVVNDEILCIAAREIEAGIFEADLGQGLCKNASLYLAMPSAVVFARLSRRGTPQQLFSWLAEKKVNPVPTFQTRWWQRQKFLRTACNNKIWPSWNRWRKTAN